MKRAAPITETLARGTVALASRPFPLHGREAFVGEVAVVSVTTHEKFAYRTLVAVGWRETEGDDDSFGTHRERQFEAVHPFGLGDVSAELCLSGEESLAASSYPHDRRNQRRVEYPVDFGAVREHGGEVALQCF